MVSLLHGCFFVRTAVGLRKCHIPMGTKIKQASLLFSKWSGWSNGSIYSQVRQQRQQGVHASTAPVLSGTEIALGYPARSQSFASLPTCLLDFGAQTLIFRAGHTVWSNFTALPAWPSPTITCGERAFGSSPTRAGELGQLQGDPAEGTLGNSGE